MRKKATLVAALALTGLVASFGCQGEDAQGGSKSGSSGSSEVTVQVGNGTFDGSAPQGATTGETTALTSGERFSEDNLRKVDEFVAQQMEQQNLPSVVVGVWAHLGRESTLPPGARRTSEPGSSVGSANRTASLA